MATNAEVAEKAHRQDPYGHPRYYGFDPDVEYLIRSRSRSYQGTTLKRKFSNGVYIAPKMRADASDDQKWTRGEALMWFKQSTGPTGHVYAVYRRGEEPPSNEEPLWFGQPLPDDEAFAEETGEERYTVAEGAFHEETAGRTAPVTKYAAVDPGDTGEANHIAPEVVKFNPDTNKVEGL
ncbi:MAG: hypothetical protein WC211_03625 [Dehalococcoidia bacterium]